MTDKDTVPVEHAQTPNEHLSREVPDPLLLTDLQKDYPKILDVLLTTYILENRDEYRAVRQEKLTAEQMRETQKAKEEAKGNPISFPDDEETEPEKAEAIPARAKTSGIIFAVDDYKEDTEYKASDAIPKDFDFEKIIPRSQKAKEIQKRRVKEKAEVFTPTWVCNVQNNLVDDEVVGKGAFNVVSADNHKEWVPTSERVFKDKSMVEAVDYVHSNRLEITAGEAPYLASPYDTVTGEYLPVRDHEDRFQRIGLLDRKLRVVTETTADIEVWNSLAYGAFCSTYGYEWQGDNLLLARLNLLNTYRDYHYDAWGEEPVYENLLQIAIIISMNIWQMDGLRAVVPLSAEEEAEKKGSHDATEVSPNRSTGYYQGKVPVISFQHNTAPYSVACENVDLGAIINDPKHSPDWVPFGELMGEFLQSKATKGKKKNGRGRG